jgi:hypothetical protein
VIKASVTKMTLSLARKILHSGRPLVLFHAWTVTRPLLAQAIRENRSMDLDVSIAEDGNPYLGHPKEYHVKTGEPFFDSIPLWEAIQELARSSIPVIVDCKQFDAWPVIDEIVGQLRPERCLVHSFVSELKFQAGREQGEPDFLVEWSSLSNLRALKQRFPSVTTSASAKWLPADVLLSEKYDALLDRIATALKEHTVDTICLNVPDSTFSDRALRLFLKNGILAHVGIDRSEPAQLSEVFIGETDRLELASECNLL